MDLPSANQMTNCAFSCIMAIVLTVEVAVFASVSGVLRMRMKYGAKICACMIV